MVDKHSSALADEPLVCLWQHEQDVDIAPLVKKLGFNTLWTDDDPYHGQRWEETHMYRALQVPGIRYVIPKVERIQWGQTHEGSIEQARWIAELAPTHPEISALYLNDFYDEIEDGYRTLAQWREIIAAAQTINPELKIIVPHYPHRGNDQRPYDFDHDAVVFNLWHHGDIAQCEQHLLQAERQHVGKPILAGPYLSSGSVPGRWLTEEEFTSMLRLFVAHANEGKTAGLRIFCACQLTERPEYVGWAKEVLKDLKPRRDP